MGKVHITENILRDAHQSLIATRMRIEDMLPACARLDKIGFWSLEAWGGATFDVCVRFLKEDPWERLSKLRAALPKTRIQMLLRGQNLLGYRQYSDDVVKNFVAHCAKNGVDVFRVFDALNDLRNIRVSIESVKANDKHAQGAISYTTSPVHTIKGYVKMAKELRSMGCDSIVIKDMAGLLTPAATTDLVKALKDAVDLPLALHSHATSGLAEMCHLKGIEHGVEHIDCSLSSFSGGTSHSPTESMVAALRGTEHDTKLDLVAIQEVSTYFWGVRKKYHQFESEFTGVDTRVQVNQVPGGMISNLANQLKGQNATHRMNEVLAEIPRVRKDLGYPPLVTPTSQIVGTQAVFNVLNGERYKTITNEVKLYLQGGYGASPAPVDRSLQRLALGNEEVIECRPADLLQPEMERLRKEIGDLAKNEEDVLIYAMFPQVGQQFLEERKNGTLVPEKLEPIPPKRCSEARSAPTEFRLTIHGETYHVKVTGTGHPDQTERLFYMAVDEMPVEVLVETLDQVILHGQPAGGAAAPKADGSAAPVGNKSGRPTPSKPGHIHSTMPGAVVKVLVAVGDKVKSGQPVLVVEAMKMETEISSPVDGTVAAILVTAGETVTPTETLIDIQEE